MTKTYWKFQKYIPYYTSSLCCWTLFVRTWCYCQYATQGHQTEWPTMGTLYIGDQLSYIPIETSVFHWLEFFGGVDKPCHQWLKHGGNNLSFRTTTETSTEIGWISTLSAWWGYTIAKIGVKIFKGTRAFMSYLFLFSIFFCFCFICTDSVDCFVYYRNGICILTEQREIEREREKERDKECVFVWVLSKQTNRCVNGQCCLEDGE